MGERILECDLQPRASLVGAGASYSQLSCPSNFWIFVASCE